MPLPAAYQTLRGGRMVWVYPEDPTRRPDRRSRLETDQEVRARLKAAGHWHYPTLSGGQLDAQLRYWDMEPRKWVDD